MKVDVCLVGGGLCGLMLAHTLNALGFSCVLLESKPELHRKTDQRALVLSYGSCQILKQLGLYSRELNTWPIETLNYSFKGFWGAVELKASNYHIPYLGQVMSAHDWMEHCLSVMDLPHTYCSACPQQLSLGEHTHHLSVTHEKGPIDINATLVVGVDGTHSWVRSQCQATLQTDLNDAAALIIPIEGAGPNTWIRNSALGSLAYVPISASNGTLIWTSTSNTIERLRNHRTRARMMQSIAGHRLTPDQTRSPYTACYPVTAQITTGRLPEGVILIGNAAQTLPPVAAQGFNLGIRDCAHFLSHCVQRRLEGNSLRMGLNQVMQARKPDIDQTYAFSLAAFQSHRWAHRIGPLTSLGLSLIHHHPTLTRSRIQSALGLMPPYHDLLKGQTLASWKKALESLS